MVKTRADHEEIMIVQAPAPTSRSKTRATISFTNGATHDLNGIHTLERPESVERRYQSGRQFTAEGRRSQSADSASIEQTRQEMWRVLSSGTAHQDWNRVLTEAKVGRISIVGDASFHQLPFELLCGLPELALRDVRIVRRLKGAQHKSAQETTDETLRILIVTARELHRDIDSRAIARPMVETGLWVGVDATIDVLRGGTFNRLNDRLQQAHDANAPYRIVHFDCHGSVDEDGSWLHLETGSDEVFSGQHPGWDRVRADKIAESLEKNRVELTVMNACRSADADASRSIDNIALTLVESGVAAAVGMRHPLSPEAASIFAKTLYESLTSRKDVDHPVAEGVALARAALRRSYRDNDLACDESILPTLYMGRTPMLRIQEREQLTKRGDQRREERLIRLGRRAREISPDGVLGRNVDERLIRSLLWWERSTSTEQRERVWAGRDRRPTRTVVLHGLRGCGKSALMLDLAYFWDQINFVTAAAWIDCAQMRDELDRDEGATVESFLDATFVEQQIASSLEEALADGSDSNTELLLAVDGIDDLGMVQREQLQTILERFGNRGNAILLTCRSVPEGLSEHETFLITGLDPQSTHSIALRASEETDDAESDELCRAYDLVDRLPSGIEAINVLAKTLPVSEIIARILNGDPFAIEALIGRETIDRLRHFDGLLSTLSLARQAEFRFVDSEFLFGLLANAQSHGLLAGSDEMGAVLGLLENEGLAVRLEALIDYGENQRRWRNVHWLHPLLGHLCPLDDLGDSDADTLYEFADEMSHATKMRLGQLVSSQFDVLVLGDA